MKTIAMMLALAGTFVSAGRAQIATLNGFVTDREAAVDTSLTGIWEDERDNGLVTIRLVGNTYSLTYSDNSGVVRLKAKLIKTATAGILDLAPDRKRDFALPAHLPVRIWLEGDTLRFAWLDTPWLMDLAKEELASEDVNGLLLITAPAEAAARFFAAHGGDDRAFKSSSELVRVR